MAATTLATKVPPPPTESPAEKAINAIVAELERIERAEVKPSLIGIFGGALLLGAAYLIWRRR